MFHFRRQQAFPPTKSPKSSINESRSKIPVLIGKDHGKAASCKNGPIQRPQENCMQKTTLKYDGIQTSPYQESCPGTNSVYRSYLDSGTDVTSLCEDMKFVTTKCRQGSNINENIKSVSEWELIDTKECLETTRSNLQQVKRKFSLNGGDLGDKTGSKVQSAGSLFSDDEDYECFIPSQNGKYYIAEAFNNAGSELMVTVFQIERKLVGPNHGFSFNDELTMSNDEDSHALDETENEESNCREIPTDGLGGPTCLEIVPPENDHEKPLRVVHLGPPPVTDIIKNVDALQEESLPKNQSMPVDSTINTIPQMLKESIHSTDKGCEIEGKNSHSSQVHIENLLRINSIRDDLRNIRNEKVVQITNQPAPIRHKSSLLRKDKIGYVIEELIQTEETYVDNLRKIVKEYKPYLERVSEQEPYLQGQTPYIFRNIDYIYRNAERFCEKLKACNGAMEKIGRTFIDFTCRFELYTLYSRDHPKSIESLNKFQKYIDEFQAEHGVRLDLSGYLIKPIERLGKYVLLLEKLLNYVHASDNRSDILKSESVSNALQMIHKEMRNGNDSIVMNSIKNCPIDLSIQGCFLLRQSFQMQLPGKSDSMVFLFEKVIVFTRPVQMSSTILNLNPWKPVNNCEEFVYENSIFLTDLSITSLHVHPTNFILTDFRKDTRYGNKENTFVLMAKTNEIKDIWTAEIENLLWQQFERLKATGKKDKRVPKSYEWEEM